MIRSSSHRVSPLNQRVPGKIGCNSTTPGETNSISTPCAAEWPVVRAHWRLNRTLSSEHFYVITGASGAGKSTLLKALGDQGYSFVPEIALALIQEQEQCGGDLFPWTNLHVFMEEVLARNIQAYDAARDLPSPIFFDRAIPECLAHMRLLGLEVKPDLAAEAAKRSYANTVFVAEPWPSPETRTRLFGELVGAARAGSLPLPVDGIYAFDDVVAAFAAHKKPGRNGKILLRP